VTFVAEGLTFVFVTKHLVLTTS